MLINLILRALPFWIREPLVIAVSLFFASLASPSGLGVLRRSRRG
jgi:hypothetical protein